MAQKIKKIDLKSQVINILGEKMQENNKIEGLNLLVLRHYIKEYSDLKPQGALPSDFDVGIKEVSKLECDANVMYSLICEKLGLYSPDILPIYSNNWKKTIVSGVINVPTAKDIEEIKKAKVFHYYLNNGYYKTSLLNSLSKAENLTESKKENLNVKLILSNIALDGKRPVDILFSPVSENASTFFSGEALKDLIKIRVAKLATFDVTNKLDSLYKMDNASGIVDRVLPIKNSSDSKTLDAVIKGERHKLKYDTELFIDPLTCPQAIRMIKEKNTVGQVVSRRELSDIANNLQSENVKDLANRFYAKTGMKINDKYVDAVSRQVDFISESLSR